MRGGAVRSGVSMGAQCGCSSEGLVGVLVGRRGLRGGAAWHWLLGRTWWRISVGWGVWWHRGTYEDRGGLHLERRGKS